MKLSVVPDLCVTSRCLTDVGGSDFYQGDVLKLNPQKILYRIELFIYLKFMTVKSRNRTSKVFFTFIKLFCALFPLYGSFQLFVFVVTVVTFLLTFCVSVFTNLDGLTLHTRSEHELSERFIMGTNAEKAANSVFYFIF